VQSWIPDDLAVPGFERQAGGQRMFVMRTEADKTPAIDAPFKIEAFAVDFQVRVDEMD
jgi:hypothetical protein